jgi:aspartate racemase
MKTLGLIGGTSWHSTIDYYRIINELVGKRLGGLNSAKLFLYSVNFEEFRPPDDVSKWGSVIELLIDVSQKLERAGAEGLVLCANTPHLVADLVQEKINIPIIHIAEATAKAIRKMGITKVILLGTKFTMEQAFFRDKLAKYNIEVVVPGEEDRNYIHRSIFDEMGKGIFNDSTKRDYLDIIQDLSKDKVGGVIFGCTEIPMLIKPEECPIPSFDTTYIHAEAAVGFALG